LCAAACLALVRRDVYREHVLATAWRCTGEEQGFGESVHVLERPH